MSEKLPQFERPPIRVIGKAPEEEKKKIVEEMSSRFRDGYVAEISKELAQKFKTLEYDKKPHEKEIISLANEILNNFISRYGIDVFDIPERNIYILPTEIYKEAGFYESSKTAVHVARQQLIALNKADTIISTIALAKTILHEMIHGKGFVSFDIAKNADTEQNDNHEKYKFGKRRLGLMVFEGYQKGDKDEYYENFRGLNEAIVSELEQRLGRMLLESVESQKIKEEIKQQGSTEFLELKIKIAKKRSISADEIEWVKDEKNYVVASYRAQRRVLHYLAEEIAIDTGMSKEKALDLFFKAHFTGNILPLARIIDKTFGDGMFRALGTMDGKQNSANQMLDYFRKQRIIKQNKNKQPKND